MSIGDHRTGNNPWLLTLRPCSMEITELEVNPDPVLCNHVQWLYLIIYLFVCISGTTRNSFQETTSWLFPVVSCEWRRQVDMQIYPPPALPEHYSKCLLWQTLSELLGSIMRFLREPNKFARPVHYSGKHSSLPLTLFRRDALFSQSVFVHSRRKSLKFMLRWRYVCTMPWTMNSQLASVRSRLVESQHGFSV